MADPRRRPSTGSCSPLAPAQVRDPAVDAESIAWEQRMQREVSASQLSQPQRNALWRHIKMHCPERARFLQHPEVQRLIRERGAAPTFPPELIRTALAQPKVTTP